MNKSPSIFDWMLILIRPNWVPWFLMFSTFLRLVSKGSSNRAGSQTFWKVNIVCWVRDDIVGWGWFPLFLFPLLDPHKNGFEKSFYTSLGFAGSANVPDTYFERQSSRFLHKPGHTSRPISPAAPPYNISPASLDLASLPCLALSVQHFSHTKPSLASWLLV